MELNLFFTKISNIISDIGYLYFLVLIVINIILWRVHPVLGVFGVAFTLAIIFGLI